MASGSKKVILAALLGNSAISVTKFAAAAASGSSAMFSEGVHSLVDTGNQILLLYGLKRAAQPPDERYPFGHGKEIYFWSFVVSILIFAVGAGVSIYEGIHGVMHPTAPESVTLSYAVLAAAILFESGAWYFAWREFRLVRGNRGTVQAVRAGKDPSLFVVLFEDTAALLGLIVALLGVWLSQATGAHWLDGAAAIVIGLILAGTAVWLAWETKSLLIGESASKETLTTIREIARRRPRVEQVNEVLTLHMGPSFVLVTMSIDFQDEETTESLEDSIAIIDHEIKQAVPEVRRVFIEAESGRSRPAAAD